MVVIVDVGVESHGTGSERDRVEPAHRDEVGEQREQQLTLRGHLESLGSDGLGEL